LILGRYFFLGLGLSFAGSTTSIVSYFLAHVIPLTALGIAVVIVGVTAATMPDQVTGSRAMKVLLRGSTLGMDPLIDEIQTRRQQNSEKSYAETNNNSSASKNNLRDLEREEEPVSPIQDNILTAIYLPPMFEKDGSNGSSSVPQDERASVYIPLARNAPTTFNELLVAPTTLLSKDKAQEGIRIFTPGAFLGQVNDIRKEDMAIEDALQYVLVESAELCSSVRASEIEDTIVVEIDDVKVQSESESYRHLLGSLPTSLAASVVAVVRAAPVVIRDEEITPAKTVARLQILEAK
jgi:hypothetical protein